jgi:glycosyltransferase involved in cell wall biosynthesis
MKFSNAEIYVLSHDSETYYKSFIRKERVKLLKTGIDTKKFVPVDATTQRVLKEKYGFDKDKRVVLHVGHLKNGRNVGELAKVSDEHQVLLVTSTLTASEQDNELRKKLSDRSNVKIIDRYLPAIEEVYQLSDMYFFPTVMQGNCIDIPLSCMEAAACNKPIVTTDFGEMREFIGKEGYYFIDLFEADKLNQLIVQALNTKKLSTRSAVLDYDWRFAIKRIKKLLKALKKGNVGKLMQGVSGFVDAIVKLASAGIPLYDDKGKEIGKQPLNTEVFVASATVLANGFAAFLSKLEEEFGGSGRQSRRLKKLIKRLSKAGIDTLMGSI